MRRTISSLGAKRRRALVAALCFGFALATAVIFVGALAEPADAAFPGLNGRIAYYGFDGDDFEIFTIPNGGGVPKKITNNASTDLDPAWSPDGKRIAYSGEVASTRTRQIFTIPLPVVLVAGSLYTTTR